MRLRKRLLRFLERERICRVATTDAEGMPHVVPVCHVVHQGRIYFASEAASRKIHNLRQNPRAAVTVDLYTEDWARLAGVLIQGTARILERGPEFRRIRRLLYEKYPQYPEEAALEEGESVIVELTPTHVAAWGLD
ncbi:MAG: pyridoxamine 5'-phosphate oxidase family protein [Armatimonadota bacterium]|nr:pyridoxamine 5'-phosphate oxidase family protein [Armatimonadota bacterium]MDR7561924.1 pyridoxamine 5'-phosphate oxidase family protein [Armatimonadota bacterium]MDR7568706.1 pyridoxamine 5'-phosphate oxidase family protein [Armatimonadota bacterium]MDR7601835.1 pyridoxamine 5'-phosphate oxidase family protein [Armatimonadota bacterium]